MRLYVQKSLKVAESAIYKAEQLDLFGQPLRAPVVKPAPAAQTASKPAEAPKPAAPKQEAPRPVQSTGPKQGDWQPIPNTKHPGGQRRRRGAKYEYRYPDGAGGYSENPPEEKPQATAAGITEFTLFGHTWHGKLVSKETRNGKEYLTWTDARDPKKRITTVGMPAGAKHVAPVAAPKTEPKPEAKPESAATEQPKPDSVVPVPLPPRAERLHVAPTLTTMKPSEGKIVDVGEKIGLARKDIAALRSTDFEALEKDPTVAYKMTTRTAVFGEYTATAADADKAAGVSPKAAWWKREILKSVSVRPPDSKDARDAYHRGAKLLSEAMSRVRSPEDVITLMQEWKDNVSGDRKKRLSELGQRLAKLKLRSGFVTAATADMTPEEFEAASAEVRGTNGLGSDASGYYAIESGPPDVKAEYAAVTQAMGRRFAEMMGLHTRKSQWAKDPTSFSMYAGGGLTDAQRKANARQREELSAEDPWGWASDKGAPKPAEPAGPDLKRGIQDGKEFVWHRKLGTVVRTGLPDRKGGKDGEALLKAFGLRGVEYGNWAADTERQWHTEMAHASLHDLADVLGISADQIAVKGRLALAFGARGTGGKRPAAAHYEPVKRVINLTKLSGNGSLAHEWGHFLDNMIAQSYSPATGKPLWLSDQSGSRNAPPAIKSAFEAVMNEIKTEPVTPERVAEISKQKADMLRDLNQMKVEIQLHQRNFRDPEIRAKYSAAVAEHNELVNKINALPRVSRDNTVTSKFYEQAQVNGKYWADDKELFARCFESYVESKLHEKGQRSSYLVDGTLNADAPGVYLDHADPHRKRINSAMEKLMGVLREHDQFNKSLQWLSDLQKAVTPRLVVHA